MNFIRQHLPIGHPNRPGIKLEGIRGIVFHYTANDAPGATDTANVRYIGRPFDEELYYDKNTGKKVLGYTEKGSKGKGANGLSIPFRLASAHIFADCDSVTEAIPTDEVSWACGDRQLAYDTIHKGQKPVARTVFNNRQNYFTVNVEICNNDVLPGLDDWDAACKNAAEWAINFICAQGLHVDIDASLSPQIITPETGKILLLRHFDVTGKICPAPFVSDLDAWMNFIESIIDG